MDTDQQKDDILWRLAKKRAGFKWSLGSYVIVNAFLVAVWYFSSGIGSYFWPIWPMLGWGIGVALQYFHAYHESNIFSAEEEYKKLKNQQDNNN
jgi:hypothetical protein